MDNNDSKFIKSSYPEIFKEVKDGNIPEYDYSSITWYDEKMTFKTIREAQEWVYSDAYNEIGFSYNGYRTTDPKLSYSLLYEIVRAKTKGYDKFTNKKVYADEKIIDGKNYYMVWIE